jgi:hypothetical protein
MRRCWLFYGDAWGFADFARHQQEDALNALRCALDTVSRLRIVQPTVEYFLFSDTVVCVRELPEEDAPTRESVDLGFEEIMVAVQFLISELLDAELILRGAVTFGKLHREKDNEVIIGDALLDAAEFERKSVSMPLVFLPAIALQKAHQAGGCSQSLLNNNMDRSVHVQTKDGGHIRAQPILGDRPALLSKNLHRALEKATLSDSISPHRTGALKTALDMVHSTIKNGRKPA